MEIEVGIWLFDVPKCGYYRGRQLVPRFGGLGDCLSGLRAWSNGRRLSETSTYDVQADSDVNQCYLVCLARSPNGDYLVGLWNRIQTNSNKIASVGVDDVVGQATTEFSEIDDDRIPGHATYFFVMPNENKVATIRVKHPLNGLHNFQRYITNFMRHIDPQHVVLGQADAEDEIPIVGYKPSRDSDDVSHLQARFRIKSIRKTGEIDVLLQQVERIRKVHCKTTITNRTPQERTFWQMGLDIFGLGARRARADLVDEVTIKTELPMTFQRDELQQIIEEWSRQARDGEAEDDLGFVLAGETSPHWLSRSYSRKNFQLDVEWLDEELVDPDFLLIQLQAIRPEILRLG